MTAVATSIVNVDFGFSFNSQVNTLAGDGQDDDGAANRTVQGSLRQFLENARAVSGANTLRFAPTEATNTTDGGGNDWWRVTVTLDLPILDDPSTTVDGTAYDFSDGTTVLNTNATVLGTVGSVGLGPDAVIATADELSLSGVAGPELAIVNDRPTNVVDRGLDLQANDLTLRNLAIHGFGGGSLMADANVRVGIDGGGTNFTGILIEDNVFGSNAASFADPGAADRSLVNNIAIMGADGGIIRDNLIGFAGRFGIFLSDGAITWTVSGNEIRANALVNAQQDGLDIGNSSSGASVTGNLFVMSEGGGIDSWRGLGGNTIENNTFSANGQGAIEPAAMRIFGTGNTIRLNDIDGSVGPGVLVVSDLTQLGSPSIQNRISQNRFSSNGSNAIDLLALGGDASLGDGITLNDGGTDVQAGNIELDYPVIASVTLVGGTATVTGTTCASCEVEIYRAVADGDLSDTDNRYGLRGRRRVRGQHHRQRCRRLDCHHDLAVHGRLRIGIAIDGSNNTSEFGANAEVPASVALAGTVTDDSETEIRAGGSTLTLTVTGDTWVAAGAPFDAERQNIINGLVSAQSEANGWNNVVQAGLAVTDVVRTSGTVVTITLPAFAGYDISATETITATVPAAALTTTAAPAQASPTFDVTTVAGSVALSGTVTNDTESDIVTGGSTILLTLTDDTWVAAGAPFDADGRISSTVWSRRRPKPTAGTMWCRRVWRLPTSPGPAVRSSRLRCRPLRRTTSRRRKRSRPPYRPRHWPSPAVR